MVGDKVAWLAGMLLLVQLEAEARTSNGNDFALFFSEAKTAAERKRLLDEARGRPHFFRYLCIVEMEEGEKDGRPYVAIKAREPGSLMNVRFVVSKEQSLKKLREQPESGVGDAIAVNGKIVDATDTDSLIRLDPVIVKRKDRLEPKVGQELLAEVDPDAVFYSYTACKPPIHLSYRDRDLLESKSRIQEQQGKQAWAEFLRKELAKRKKQRGGD